MSQETAKYTGVQPQISAGLPIQRVESSILGDQLYDDHHQSSRFVWNSRKEGREVVSRATTSRADGTARKGRARRFMGPGFGGDSTAVASSLRLRSQAPTGQLG